MAGQNIWPAIRKNSYLGKAESGMFFLEFIETSLTAEINLSSFILSEDGFIDRLIRNRAFFISLNGFLVLLGHLGYVTLWILVELWNAMNTAEIDVLALVLDAGFLAHFLGCDRTLFIGNFLSVGFDRTNMVLFLLLLLLSLLGNNQER